MVFSSIQAYLDPPNWQQQHNQQSGAAHENPQLPLPPPPPPPPGGGCGGGGCGSGSGSAGSIRPGSMAERARLAKIPQPEAALKCPRCESTNTKFCYFNNYSLSQPRHFCKTCRRYWTRGGALRNVPVGGGCRRNKRSKGSNNRSKSPSKASSSTSSGLVSNSCTPDMIGHHNMVPPPPQLPILPPLHHLNDYNSTDIGLNFGGIQPHVAATTGGGDGGGMEFQIGSTSAGGGSILSSGIVDQWRLQQVQQFPFLGNLEAPSGLYPFENEGVEAANYVGQLRSKPLESQLAAVKMEENQHNQLNLSKNFLGISGNYQYWGTANAWSSDLPGFTSSSTTHLL